MYSAYDKYNSIHVCYTFNIKLLHKIDNRDLSFCHSMKPMQYFSVYNKYSGNIFCIYNYSKVKWKKYTKVRCNCTRTLTFNRFNSLLKSPTPGAIFPKLWLKIECWNYKHNLRPGCIFMASRINKGTMSKQSCSRQTWFSFKVYSCILIHYSQVQKTCEDCGTEFGKYFCEKCRLYDNADKGQYHCDGCGLCRYDT